MSVYVSGILGTLTDPLTILYVFIGTFMGLIFGCLPGLTASMGIALLIPLTFMVALAPGILLVLVTESPGTTPWRACDSWEVVCCEMSLSLITPTEPVRSFFLTEP